MLHFNVLFQITSQSCKVSRGERCVLLSHLMFLANKQTPHLETFFFYMQILRAIFFHFCYISMSWSRLHPKAAKWAEENVVPGCHISCFTALLSYMLRICDILIITSHCRRHRTLCLTYSKCLLKRISLIFQSKLKGKSREQNQNRLPLCQWVISQSSPYWANQLCWLTRVTQKNTG